MFQRGVVLWLALLSPCAWGRQIYDDPYVSLLELKETPDWRRELNLLRSGIQQERARRTDDCRKEEKRLEQQLEAARLRLRELNESAAQDSAQMAATRDGLHKIADASAGPLQKIRMECGTAATSEYETRKAKLEIAGAWPESRQEILRAVDHGQARKRRFGDVDDIGYRKFFDGQDKDIPLGEQTLRQMTSSAMMPDPLQDAAVQEYARRLGLKIAANSDLKVPLRITVLNSNEVSAVALPGGFVFLSSGLLEAAGTEAEVAGILSHEIARIAARHGTRASRRSRISSVFLQAVHVAAGFLAGSFTNAAALNGFNLGFQGVDALVNRALLSAQGRYEEEADQLGVQYAWKAGYDPRGFVMLLDSIARQDPSKTASFLRTHPHPAERVLDVFREIRFLPEKPDLTRDSIEFHEVRERIQGRSRLPSVD